MIQLKYHLKSNEWSCFINNYIAPYQHTYIDIDQFHYFFYFFFVKRQPHGTLNVLQLIEKFEWFFFQNNNIGHNDHNARKFQKKKKSQQIPKRAVHGNVTNEQHQQERPNCWDEKKSSHGAQNVYRDYFFFLYSVWWVLSAVNSHLITQAR